MATATHFASIEAYEKGGVEIVERGGLIAYGDAGRASGGPGDFDMSGIPVGVETYDSFAHLEKVLGDKFHRIVVHRTGNYQYTHLASSSAMA